MPEAALNGGTSASGVCSFEPVDSTAHIDMFPGRLCDAPAVTSQSMCR